MHKKILLVVVITILFLGTYITPSVAIKTPIKTISSGNTLYVGGTGEGNYTNIMDAVRDAIDGDTIFVYDDMSPYYGIVAIRKTINLIGENKSTTVIDGEEFRNVVELYNDSIWIDNFTLRNSKKEPSYYLLYSGIKCFSNFNTITNCIFYDDYCGISSNIDDSLSFSNNNTVESNYFYNNKYGIRFYGNGNKIINNLIENIDYRGIQIRNSYNLISGNVIKNKGLSLTGMGIYIEDGGNNNVENNHISKNEVGIYIDHSYGNKIEKNNFKFNIVHASYRGYFFKSTPKTIWRGNYWNRPRILPKLIYGIGLFDFEEWMWPMTFPTPDSDIDWHPAKKPYDI